jgi:uncharacterized repeat protein (TIGR01451 family)
VQRRGVIAALVLFLSGLWSPGVSAIYINRYATTTRGAVTFTGNTLGLSKQSDANAPGTADSIGTFITTNPLSQDGTYPFGTTANWQQNGSSAVLTLPAGSTVLYAELIWGGTSNVGGENVSAFLNNSVSLTTPLGTSAVPPAAATAQSGANSRYVRSADVTALVTAGGAGTYTVGGVPGTQGSSENTDNTAGWTLAVVYANPALAVRNLTVFAGAEGGGAAPAQISGFCTQASGGISGRVLVSAEEGDSSRTGDEFRFGPTSTLGAGNRLSGPNNPLTNFFASQINNDAGTLNTSGSFGTLNHPLGSNASGRRQGWDITNINGSAQLTNNQTQAFAQGTTTGDQYTINGLGLQIDVRAPSFPVTVKQVDKTLTYVGDVLTYTVTVQNDGDVPANDVIFTDDLPAGTSYVAGSFEVDNVAQATTPPFNVNLGTINNGAQQVVTFQARVDFVPATPPRDYRNTASWTYTYDACGTPIPGSVTTNEVASTVTAVSGYKSVKLTTDADASLTPTPGDTLTWSLFYTNTGSATATGFQITDSLPTDLGIIAPGAQTVTTTQGSCTLVPNPAYTGTVPNTSLLAAGGTLAAGCAIRIDIPTTIGAGVSGARSNQATSTSSEIPPAGILTDNVDNTTAGLPAGVVVPAASIPQLQVPSIDPTSVLIPGVTISGTVFEDRQPNGTRDAGEAGTGQTLYVKLTARIGGICTAPATPVVADPATGAYSLVGVAAGNYCLLVDDNSIAGDITPTTPTGWTFTGPSSGVRAISVAAPDITLQDFGLFRGARLAGRVFADTGAGAGIANDGTQNGTEAGIAGVTVRLTDSTGTTTYGTDQTDASGAYTLYIPASITSGTALRVVETNPGGHLSTGGQAGTTAGTYDRVADTVSFTLTAGTGYTGADFADVPLNGFLTDGLQTALPGTTIYYPHTFTAGSGGTVGFSTSAIATPALAGWSETLWTDSDCDGAFDSGEPPLSGPLTLSAGEQVCLLVKEFVPATAPDGAQNQVTVTASFTYTNAGPLLATTHTRTDTTTVGNAALRLQKAVDQATALPGDTLIYTITYTNTSANPLSTLVIRDATPVFTTFLDATCGAPPAGLVCTLPAPPTNAPAAGGTGPVIWSFTGSLTPGGSASVSYRVRVDS